MGRLFCAGLIANVSETVAFRAIAWDGIAEWLAEWPGNKSRTFWSFPVHWQAIWFLHHWDFSTFDCSPCDVFICECLWCLGALFLQQSSWSPIWRQPWFHVHIGTKSEAYSNTDCLIWESQTYGSDGWSPKPIPWMDEEMKRPKTAVCRSLSHYAGQSGCCTYGRCDRCIPYTFRIF